MTKSLSKEDWQSICQQVVENIDNGFASQKRGEARSYIGASMAGTECIAQLALSLRGFPDDEPEPRTKRIFRDGHRIEDEVVRDLKKRADLLVHEKDEWSGRQHRREWLGGHVVCNSDGLVTFEGGDIPDDERTAILEIKSMKNTMFNKFVKHGVQKSHPKYYSQCQMMMAMFKIPKAFFISYCKNSSAYHAEMIFFDQEEWDAMFVRIQAALSGQKDRCATKRDDFRCTFCFKQSACWEVPDVEPECRFCEHSFANEQGGFSCSRTGEEHLGACDDFKLFRPTPKV